MDKLEWNEKWIASIILVAAVSALPFAGLIIILAAVIFLFRTKPATKKTTRLLLLAICIGFMSSVFWTLIFIQLVPKINVAQFRNSEQETYLGQTNIDDLASNIKFAFQNNVYITIERRRFPSFRSETITGSGVIIGRNQSNFLILTSRHVIDPDFDPARLMTVDPKIGINVQFLDGNSRPAYVYWTEPNGIDLAVLGIGSTPTEVPVEGRRITEPVRIGERVFTVGNPQDLTWSYTEGIISSIRDSGKESPTYKVFQTQTPINQGNSGGGLYRMNGELVGIIAWTKDKSQSEGIGFAIAYEDFLKLYNVNE